LREEFRRVISFGKFRKKSRPELVQAFIWHSNCCYFIKRVFLPAERGILWLPITPELIQRKRRLSSS
jgi:hypothetical protein